MKKFLVTLLVAMLALSAVALADVVDTVDNHGYINAAGKLICPNGAYSQAPTCTEEGWCIHETGTGKVYYVLTKLAHTPKAGASELTKEPTCSEYGEYTHICSVCGETFTTKVDPVSHPDTFFYLQAPTCTTVGIAAIGCPYCETYDPDTLRTWWKGGKDGETKEIEDVEYIFDADCAKTNISNDPKDHVSPSSWLIISEKDCYNPLVKQSYCSACQTTMTVVEAKKNHELGNAKLMMLNNPNCETVAVYAVVKACKNCDYFVAQHPDHQTVVKTNGGLNNYYTLPFITANHQVAKDAINSVYNSMKSKSEETVGAYYLVTPNYLMVKYIDNVDGIEAFAKGHHVADPATRKLVTDNSEKIDCTYEGNDKAEVGDILTSNGKLALYNTYAYKCTVCKAEVAEEHEMLTAPAHEYTAWKQIVEPTEDTNFIGKWSRYCLECGKLEEYIGGVCGKENHLEDEPELENVVEATYTADGSAEEVIYCAVCGEELSRKDVVLPMLEGINPDDNTLYEDGKASTATGIVTVDGKETYLINGVKQVNALGAILVDGEWYWMAHGVVQTQAKGAQLYDGEWFYVENGEIDITKNGLVAHDGEKFWVACGRLTTEYTGLVQNGSEWILISAGRFADDYTGVVTYDGAQFNVENGIVK